MRSILALLFPKPQIDVEAELRGLIDQKKTFIENRQQQKCAFRDKALWLKAQMNWADDDIAQSEREIAVLERAFADLMPLSAEQSLAAAEQSIDAAISEIAIDLDDYDPADDARKSYDLAVQIKRERGDKHWPAPNPTSKRQKAEAEAV